MDKDRCQAWKLDLDHDTIHCWKVKTQWSNLDNTASFISKSMVYTCFWAGKHTRAAGKLPANPKSFCAPVFNNVWLDSEFQTCISITDHPSYCEELRSFRGLEVQLATWWQRLQVSHLIGPLKWTCHARIFNLVKFRDRDGTKEVSPNWLIHLLKRTWHAGFLAEMDGWK